MKLGWRHKLKPPSLGHIFLPVAKSTNAKWIYGYGRGSSPRERGNSMAHNRPSSVSQEYKAALRTDSYVELWNKVQSQLMRSTSIGLLTSVSSRNLFIDHFSNTLLEPGRETLAGMIKNLRLHHLLVEYFEASSEACDVCQLLLIGVYQTRVNYKRIRKVIKLTRRANDCSSNYTDCQCKVISRELGAFSSLRNPLSVVSPVQFHDMNESSTILLHELIEKRERIKRKAKLARFCEQTGSCCLVVSCGVMAIASFVLAAHGVLLAVAVPGLISSCFGLGLFPTNKKKAINDSPLSTFSTKWNKNKSHKNKRLRVQLDVAAKGLYVLLNDMGTMGSLLGRLQDEIEHTLEWADMGAKNSKSDKILREVMRELDLNCLCFMERLEELEEHIYLCLLTINKSRRFKLDSELAGPH
ncbi:hypothetical protein CRG98_004494 [Punica granatum]|uniref:Uncharacterized protein n=1 Tax=Punica granatum TaxID=22663 RepID=A0A2I0L374_PUNGR|nr:hypothetical protein CRG98_004494 [Punica granatum]